jgi:CHAT domain-containing protein/Tfp pilus assembly protein PilF
MNKKLKNKADHLVQKGIDKYNQGQWEAALQLVEQALAIYQAIKDYEWESNSFGILGTLYYNLRNYPKAIEYSRNNLNIAKKIKDAWGESQALVNLGNIYQALGDYAKAIEHHQQSLKIAQEIADKWCEGQAVMNLGNAYYALGDYEQANAYHQQSLKITQETGDRRGECLALGNLGIVHHDCGFTERAIHFFQQSLIIAEEIADSDARAGILGNLGGAYYFLGDYEQAITYSRQYLQIAQKMNDPWRKERALLNLGNSYQALGNYTEANNYFQDALKIAQKIGDKQLEGQALNNLGCHYLQLGNFAEAEKILFAGIYLWESLRTGLGSNDTQKISIFETQSKSYRLLQMALIAQNKIEVALEVSERGRARAFIELLASKLFTNEVKLKHINTNPPSIEQIQKIAQNQKSTIVEYSITYHSDFRFQNQEVFWLSELFIWVIQPSGEIHFRRCGLRHLWQEQNTTFVKLIDSTRESMGLGGRDAVRAKVPKDSKQYLQKLYQLLIQPIIDLLPNKITSPVIFIPQGPLFLVPFPALQDDSGEYLIEKHTILTVPSIQVLDLTQKQRQDIRKSGLKDILIVGNPYMPSVTSSIGEAPQPLRQLPGAEEEAKEIAPLLNSQPLIGTSATKNLVVQRMLSSRIIHLATHGLLDEFRGLGSAIALAPSKDDNGLLTAEEILDLKLNAELVVLSACDTGRGRLTGDGVIGLSRSFISAGVPSIIVSLWSVPDAPTAILMKKFYKNLQQKNNKAQALRQAMLETMDITNHPRNWAAFTLIGEAD